jgi:hypothetical protein
MAIEASNTIISITELAETLETSPQYMKEALKKSGIRILEMNRRPSQQYVSLMAVQTYLMGSDDE